MAHSIEEHNPLGGLDSDSEVRRLPKGDYLDALCLRNGVTYQNEQGVGTNLQGTLPITTYLAPYNGYNGFPAGINKELGYFEDIVNNTVLYYMYNSNGNHGIYRYYPTKIDANNPLGIVEQVIQYNFGWQVDERITSSEYFPATSGDLLYWVDSTGLHNINLDRANVVGRQKSWRIYLVNATLTIANFGVTLTDFSGTDIVFTTTNVGNYPNPLPNGQPRTLPNYLAYVAQQINAHYGQYLTVTTCDCYLEITEVGTNGWNLTINSGIGLVVAENWYGVTLGDILFARAIAPFLYPPKLSYKADPTYAPNNVKNKVFQGALQLYMTDQQQSVLSVASQIPINNLQCDGTNNPTLNYIDIDFNNPDFIANLSLWLVVIKQIGIIVRQHNTGSWATVELLYPCDFIDYNTTTNVFFCHYKFYNDIEATVVDTTTSVALDSGVPIYADSENTIFNRNISGGITQGRDAPECVQADYSMTISATESQKLYPVTFYLRILTYGLSRLESNLGADKGFFGRFHTSDGFLKYPFWTHSNPIINYAMMRGGIYHDTTRQTLNYPYFGGGSFQAAGGSYAQRAGMEDTFNQLCPLAGFPIYSAGKPFVGITKQINVGLPIDALGALDTSNSNNIANIGNYYANTVTEFSSDLYHQVTLMLPLGEHVMRVASHWCSFGDVLNYGNNYNLTAGTSYQKTSTNVWGIYPPGSGVHPMLGANPMAQQKEITINVTGPIADAGTFIVMDIAPPADNNPETDFWSPINMYLYDSYNNNNGNPIFTSNANDPEFDGVPVEKAVVLYSTNAPSQQYLGWNNACTTDHNGYFFGISSGSQEMGAFQVGQDPSGPDATIIAGDLTIFQGKGTVLTTYGGTLSQLFTKTLTPTTVGINSNFQKIYFGILTTQTIIARQKCSTLIEGRVIDQNGTGISNAIEVYQNGQIGNSDVNGNFEFVAWGDMIVPNGGNFSNPNFPGGDFVIQNNNDRISDSLIYSLPVECSGTYPNGQLVGPLQITPFNGNPYSPTVPFIVPDFTITETVIAVLVAQKRGGKKPYGLRYLDLAGRVCSVVEGFAAYIPYLTEDLSKYPTVINPATNLPYAAPTVLGGQPTLSWAFKPNFAPPIYAAYYQWMWALDGIYKTELQWVANSVQYVSAFANSAAGAPAIDTSFSNGNYVGALISISNLLQYAQVNPDSLIGYSYTAGDRLRLISDRNNVLLNTPGVYTYTQGIYDFEITGTDSNNNLLVKLPLLPFEIQSGFTIEIYTPANTAGGTAQVFYEVGEVYKCTNPGKPNNTHSVTSAKFTSGDTYWRGRIIQVADSLTDFIGTYPVIIEAPQISDFYSSTDSSINPTRIGIIDPNLKQIYYRDRLIVSDAFQEGTAYNGLNFCLPTNTSDLGAHLGNVARLIVIGKVLHAIMRNANVSNYVGVVSLQYAQATSTVEAISSQFLGTQYPSLENIGTDWPATIQSIDSYIFGFFQIRKNVWRFATDGTIEISRNEWQDEQGNKRTRMVTFFQNLCSTGVWDAVAIYDKHYREYILTVWQNYNDTGNFENRTNTVYSFAVTDASSYTVGEIVNITFTDTATGKVLTLKVTVSSVSATSLGLQFGTDIYTLANNAQVKIVSKGNGTTIAWNEDKKRWVSRYPFIPDGYASLGDSIYSFVDSTMWVHDVNPIMNNFYGVQYNTMVTPVFNERPEWYKVWNSCILLTKQADNNNDWQATSVTNDNGQQSIIAKGTFTKSGENWYTPFFRDLNDLTVAPNLRLSQGRWLRSSSLTCVLVNDATVSMKLYGWSANWTLSQRTSS